MATSGASKPLVQIVAPLLYEYGSLSWDDMTLCDLTEHDKT